FFAIEAKRETLGAAARLEEFIQLDRDRLVTPGPQVGPQLLTAGVGDYCLPHDDGVTAETQRFRLVDREQATDVALENLATVCVEGVGIVNRLARCQRAKARIEMVKARIDQLHG